MTDTQIQPVEADLEESEIEHICCCLDELGEVTPSLCGQDVTEYCGTYIEDVPPSDWCVVCTELNAADWCPRLGHCPYGKDRDVNRA